MALEINLTVDVPIPSQLASRPFSSIDVVRAIHENLYPGCSLIPISTQAMEIAEYYRRANPVVIDFIYKYMGPNLTDYILESPIPGVVRVYEKSNYNG